MESLEWSDSEVGLGFESRESLMACLLLRGLENEGDGFGEPVPSFFFGGELFAAFGGEAIEAGLAVVFRFAPIGRDPAAFSNRWSAG